MNLLAKMGCMELLGLLYQGRTPIHRSEFTYADDKGAYIYAGYNERTRVHHFWVAMRSDDGQIAVRDFEMWLGEGGRRVAEMLVDPIALFQDDAQVLEFIWAKRRAQEEQGIYEYQ